MPSRLLKECYITVILYGCEIWRLTLREKHRLKAFQNRVLRRIFKPTGEEVTGGGSALFKEGFHDLYISPNIIGEIKPRTMRWTEYMTRMGHTRNAYKILILKERDYLGDLGIDGRII
jgi:hypothetical protein